ncbi:hypothetical protein HNQ92_002275 [Rhabdobacter roseus]|uniref:Two component regulator propeller n=1 Tax=Rhabdobacter roseus TaxID=1655419 RepID=A0A840TRF5_9BACT|nr:two-component regulator propeller domain-containing protein [Rhabdobacter roseus]MBB5284132.1 hypothetical protein [Rhabdobacter roseus]
MLLAKSTLRAALWALVGGLVLACQSTPPEQEVAESTYQDVPFWQEYHEAYPVGSTPEANDVRSIAVDRQGQVWIATAAGIFVKKETESTWSSPFQEGGRATPGPAYVVAVDAQDNVWLGTWDGLYKYHRGTLEKIDGPLAPISTLCVAPEGTYALGPHGVWFSADGDTFTKKNYAMARSIRDALSDQHGGLWVASDVGLYHVTEAETTLFRDTTALLSAYVKGIALDDRQRLWAGGLGGVSILQNQKKAGTLTTEQGLPTAYVTRVRRAPHGTLWVGTEAGVVRYDSAQSTPSLLFSRRWLLHDHVHDIAFDAQGNAWVATARGVSAIKRQQMTLAQKNDYFQEVLLRRHIRAPWIAGQCRLTTPGDTTTWVPEDDDNDGEYTGNYLAMEAFRYAVTKSPEARENARKAFGFLKLLQEVTGTDGFFARTIVPTHWTELHDGNRTFSPQQRADELVKEPRFKPVETRWRKSKDGQWLWKGDTSSDEMCGHMFGYFFYYELAADEAEKTAVRQHVARIVDHLMAHNYNLTDVDGHPTRWGVWSPEQLNRDPEWAPDRHQNAMELLAFLKLAHYLTQDEKYQREYLRLIEQEKYLDHMAQVPQQNPAWFIYFDVMLQAYVYPLLIKGETDPERLAFYQKHLDDWFARRRGDHNPLINFIYNYCRGQKAELPNSIAFLKDTPLDLIDWPIDHTRREDVRIVRRPVLEDLQVDRLQPPSIRMTVRWDKNPWTAAGGDPSREREPVFWQLPYWMGRYLGMIQ